MTKKYTCRLCGTQDLEYQHAFGDPKHQLVTPAPGGIGNPVPHPCETTLKFSHLAGTQAATSPFCTGLMPLWGGLLSPAHVGRTT